MRTLSKGFIILYFHMVNDSPWFIYKTKQNLKFQNLNWEHICSSYFNSPISQTSNYSLYLDSHLLNRNFKSGLLNDHV